jgi:hypothetical protein
MVCAFCNVANPKIKRTSKAAETRQEPVLCAGANLHKVELIESLVFVACLRGDLNVFLPGGETIDQIDPDVTPVMVLEGQPTMIASDGQIRRKANLNFADALLHLLNRGKANRNEMERQIPAVDVEGKVLQDTICVRHSLGLGDCAVPVGVDA